MNGLKTPPPIPDDALPEVLTVAAPSLEHLIGTEDETVPVVQLMWGRALILASPALFFAAFGGLLGPATLSGAVFIAVAVSYLLLDVIYLHPRFVYVSPAVELEEAALSFLQHSLAADTIEEVVAGFQQTLEAALGIDDSMVLVPMEGSLHAFGGTAEEAAAAAMAASALEYLEQSPQAITREDLEASAIEPGAKAALELLNVLRGDFFVPLFRAGSLLGLAVSAYPARFASHAERFFEAIGVHLTMGLMNCHLRDQSGNRLALSHAFALANAVQEALMPEERPVKLHGLQIRGFSRPAEECGGDVWSWHDLGEGKTLIFIGDATGHGASPATLAASVSGAVSAYAMTAGPKLQPDALLTDLNRLVHRVGVSHHMLTAFAAVVDVNAQEVSFASAGHNLPYVIRRKNDAVSVESLVARGNILGAEPEWQAKLNQQKIAPGDKIIFYTDGIPEAGEPDIQQFGDRRFRKSLEMLADEPADAIGTQIQDLVLEHLGEHSPADDMTFIAVELT